MIQKLVKHGDELALVIDRELLRALQIDELTELNISLKEGQILIAPISDAEYQQRFQEAMTEVNEQYAEAFKKLSE